MNTAQGTELKNLVENVKGLLGENYKKKLLDLGIQEDKTELITLNSLVEYELLDEKKKKKDFIELREKVNSYMKQEEQALGGNRQEAYYWTLDRIIYTFFNRIFAIRVMEELDLLKESTLKPQADLGNRSARTVKIQEKYYNLSENEWYRLMLEDAFDELTEEIRVIFDKKDPLLHIWPDKEVIVQIIAKLNVLDNDLYIQEDIFGWFYHYYVLKFRKGHKTMSAHGSKAPLNPYYLSVLNTVYTPLWMVQTLGGNSFGNWWLERHPESPVFSESPYLIRKIPKQVKIFAKRLDVLKILDPACGSGNFLLYIYRVLFKCYREEYPNKKISEICSSILENNIYGIDINRRPAQLAVLGLYILTKRLIKELAPSEFISFKIPSINIIACDIRLPKSEVRTIFLQKIPTTLKSIVKESLELFDNADQLGFLIDVQGLQQKVIEIQKRGLNGYLSKSSEFYDLLETINNLLQKQGTQNLGLMIFGEETKKALTLASIMQLNFDFIFGNPPFGFLIQATQKYIKNNFPNSYRDLISVFIDQSLRNLNEGGYLSFVTDHSLLKISKFEKFRKNILLKNFIKLIITTTAGALPDAGNFPILIILAKNRNTKSLPSFFRSENFIKTSVNISEQIKGEIETLNKSSNLKEIQNWNLVHQTNFLKLPKFIIDLKFEEKFKEIYELFTKYPVLDFDQLSKEVKKNLKFTNKYATVYKGVRPGAYDIFIRYWFEIKPSMIRSFEYISTPDDIPNFKEKPFVPLSKGGGDNQYYLNNGYVLWWNEESLMKLQEFDFRISNPHLAGKSDLIWSYVSRGRSRFCISQKKLLSTHDTNSIKIYDTEIDKYALAAYLNSNLITFLARLLTKDRKWPIGTVARLPLPIEFLKMYTKQLSMLAQESYELRREWDSGYPMSPLFSESHIDKLIQDNPTIENINYPKTTHPFTEDYTLSNFETITSIRQKFLVQDDFSLQNLLSKLEMKFIEHVSRLKEIDKQINNIIYCLVSDKCKFEVENSYQILFNKLDFIPQPNIWLNDFISANLIKIIQSSPKGIISIEKHSQANDSLYEKMINLLCVKFNKNINTIQATLIEIENLLTKQLKNWIKDDFFFYHCQRYGGRPIIWQFSSKRSSKLAAMDIFIDYHQMNENTLGTIRIDYIRPFLKFLIQRRDTGLLSEEETYKPQEVEEFFQDFLALEHGYKELPSPNMLSGKNAQPGKGDDKTYKWVFSEATQIIKNGYKPDHFKGVLVNIIPLCIDIPEKNKSRLNTKYSFICPKSTIKYVLKKIETLDLLKQKTTLN